MSTLPVEWLDGVVTAARERGRDFDVRELTSTELEILSTSFKVGRKPEEAATILCGGVVYPLTAGDLEVLH